MSIFWLESFSEDDLEVGSKAKYQFDNERTSSCHLPSYAFCSLNFSTSIPDCDAVVSANNENILFCVVDLLFDLEILVEVLLL